MRSQLKAFNHGSSDIAWHQYITGVVLNQCKVCKKNMLNEYQFCIDYIGKKHEMSIPAYKTLEQ